MSELAGTMKLESKWLHLANSANDGGVSLLVAVDPARNRVGALQHNLKFVWRQPMFCEAKLVPQQWADPPDVFQRTS